MTQPNTVPEAPAPKPEIPKPTAPEALQPGSGPGKKAVAKMEQIKAKEAPLKAIVQNPVRALTAAPQAAPPATPPASAAVEGPKATATLTMGTVATIEVRQDPNDLFTAPEVIVHLNDSKKTVLGILEFMKKAGAVKDSGASAAAAELMIREWLKGEPETSATAFEPFIQEMKKAAEALATTPPPVVAPPAGGRRSVEPIVPAEPYINGTPPAPAVKPFDPSKPVSDGNVPPPKEGEKGAKSRLEPVKPETKPVAPATLEGHPNEPAQPEQQREAPAEKPEPEGTIRFDMDPYEKNTERKERGLIKEMTQTQFKDHLRRMFEAHCAQSVRGAGRKRESAMVDGSLEDLLKPERFNAILESIAQEIYVESDEFQRGTVNYYQAYQKAWQIFVEELRTFRDTELEGPLRDHPIFKSGAFDQRDAPGIYHDGVLVALPSNLRTGAGYHETARLRTKEGRDKRYGIMHEKPAYQYTVTDPRTGEQRTITSKEMKTWRDTHTIVKPPSTVNDLPNSIQALVDARYRTPMTRALAKDLALKKRDGKTPAASMKDVDRAVTLTEENPADRKLGIPQILSFATKPQYYRKELVTPVRYGIVRVDQVQDDPTQSRVATMEFEKADTMLTSILNDPNYEPLLSFNDSRIFTPKERAFIRDSVITPKQRRDWRFYDSEQMWNLYRRGGRFDQVKKAVSVLNKSVPSGDWLDALEQIQYRAEDPVEFVEKTEKALKDNKVDLKFGEGMLDAFCLEHTDRKTWKEMKKEFGAG